MYDGYQNYQATTFAQLLLYVVSNGAEEFAEDLALNGTRPDGLRALADEWKKFDLHPASVYDRLIAIADDWQEAP